MYGDFECPFCTAAQKIIARVQQRLGDRLRFVFRHFPLSETHPHARATAEAAEAAGAQGRFWEMHDALFDAGGRFSHADLVANARGIGLEVARFEAELHDGTHAARVDHDIRTASEAGVTGTPAFFANGTRVDGAFDAGSLVEALLA